MKSTQSVIRKAIFLSATGFFLTGGTQSALADTDNTVLFGTMTRLQP